jgi:hypothetical protein
MENRSEHVYQKRDVDYLEQGQREREVRELIRVQGSWIEKYMSWLSRSMDDNLRAMKELRHIKDGTQEVEELLTMEHEGIEMLLVDEVRGWEEKVREDLEEVIKQYGTEGEELRKKWRADLWERVEEGRREMEARLERTRKNELERSAIVDKADWESAPERICSAWQSPFEQLNTQSSSSHQSPSRLEKALADRIPLSGSIWFKARLQGMEKRLRCEAEHVEARLRCNPGLCCNEFERLDLEYLINLTHSESKWQCISCINDARINSALKRNQHVTHIDVDWTVIGDITSLFNAIPTCVTSIFCRKHHIIPANTRLSSSILSISMPNTTLPNEHQRALERNLAQLKKTRRTTLEFAGMVYNYGRGLGVCGASGEFTIRFFGPSSGFVKLQLTHNASCPHQILELEINGSLVLKHLVPESKSFEEIMLSMVHFT